MTLEMMTRSGIRVRDGRHTGAVRLSSVIAHPVGSWRLALEDGLHDPESARLESVEEIGEHERRGGTEDDAETEGLG